MPAWFLLASFATLGAIWGSFVGALCSRWPKGESVVKGRSHCDGCSRTIAGHDLIPIFSYLLLGGKCRHCGHPIPRDVPAIEIAALCLGVLPLALFPPGQALAVAIFGWLLLPLFILDYRHLWLPDRLIVLLAAASAIFGGLMLPEIAPIDRLWGGVAGYGVLQAIRLLFFAVRKMEGMGAGDPKLFGAIGFWVGWQGLPLILLLATLLGLFCAIVLKLPEKQTRSIVAFGTMLSASALAIVYFPAVSAWNLVDPQLLMR